MAAVRLILPPAVFPDVVMVPFVVKLLAAPFEDKVVRLTAPPLLLIAPLVVRAPVLLTLITLVFLLLEFIFSFIRSGS